MINRHNKYEMDFTKIYFKIRKSLFVIILSIFCLASFLLMHNQLSNDLLCTAENINLNGDVFSDITFSYGDNVYNLEDINVDVTLLQQKILYDFDSRVSALNFAIDNGIDIEKAFLYSFPEIVRTVNDIESKTKINPYDANISVIKNTAKIMINKSKNGVKIDKNTLFLDILNSFNLKNNKNNFTIKDNEIFPEVITEDVKIYGKLRGSFSTNFSSSSEARKNNIRNALKQFDGVTLLPGEVLSFNTQTGIRNEDSGYQRAKIIKNGVFVEEFGGGVCQVSTTIYNAALLAGLEIIEVHPHSLPVSYIEPCFDAMVNMGSSDLVIKNNLDYPVIFATSDLNDICKVNIYGNENEYKAVRRSEKTEEILSQNIIYTSDYNLYGFTEPLSPGEEKILSNAKPGYKACGWIEYYKDDILVKTSPLRKNTYNATNQVVLVGNKNS